MAAGRVLVPFLIMGVCIWMLARDIDPSLSGTQPEFTTNQPHEQDEDYEVALNAPPWKGTLKHQE